MKPFTIAASAALLATSAVALYAAVPALAAPGWDRNATMTWSEVKAKTDGLWTKLDVNKDGVVSEVDRDAKLGQKFDEIDAGRDGQISREEWTAHHRAMMERVHGRMEGMEQDGPKGRRGRGHRGMGHGGMGMMPHEMLKAADTNRDGKLTRAEFDAGAKARFDKADANRDGKLSPDERRAAMAAMRRGGPAMGDMPPPPPEGM